MSGEFEAEARKSEPITFSLGGREWMVRPNLSAAIIFRFAHFVQGKGAEPLLAFEDLLTKAVCKEQREDLRMLLTEIPDEDDAPAVAWEEVQQTAMQLFQRLTGSPFGQSSDSPPSPLVNGAMSKGRASSEASTLQPPRRAKLS